MEKLKNGSSAEIDDKIKGILREKIREDIEIQMKLIELKEKRMYKKAQVKRKQGHVYINKHRIKVLQKEMIKQGKIE